MGYVAIKMGMRKVYDHVEWGFLRTMTIKMGFCWGWVNKVMHMLTAVTYQFSHDGKQLGKCFSKKRLDAR